MPKQKATTLPYMEKVLVWLSGHVSLTIGHGALTCADCDHKVVELNDVTAAL